VVPAFFMKDELRWNAADLKLNSLSEFSLPLLQSIS